MGAHGVYIGACVGLWLLVVVWNIIPPYRAWAQKMKDRG
jgi:heme exporter protein CcmD